MQDVQTIKYVKQLDKKFRLRQLIYKSVVILKFYVLTSFVILITYELYSWRNIMEAAIASIVTAVVGLIALAIKKKISKKKK